MAWTTPKTDWYGERDTERFVNTYSGDRFNLDDYNRLRNNITALKNLAETMFGTITLRTMGYRILGDPFLAENMNAIEENFETINRATLNRDYGNRPVYVNNGPTPTYTELNRLEGAMGDLYDRLTNLYYGRRRFTWNMGMQEGL